MDSIKISVIVPVYNTQRYLDRCVNSLVTQTYEDFEVILVDDASKDYSKIISDYWHYKDPRVRVVHRPENHGVAVARNLGLEEANGDLICFVDSDDWAEPTYLANFAKMMRRDAVDMAICGYYGDLPHFKPTNPPIEHYFNQPKMLQEIMKVSGGVRGFLWNKCYRLSTIKQNQLRFDETATLMEDQLFNFDYVAKTDLFYSTTMPLYHYLTRADSAIHSITPKKILEEINMSNQIQKKVSNLKKKNRPLLSDD